MSSEWAITAENLGKRYLIRHQTASSYTALRDVLTDRAKQAAQRMARPILRSASGANPSKENFWALQDVSFVINPGERVGVIGRNGAGKSTLLKILSRITDPSSGRLGIRGRVASLLEVGTGFHPELTGRENIYLNGAVLGMRRAEIKRKFDEIVDFAEVERFLDTPVKRYSSGMYVRLAFAVAAHLEPEILIVDEVLAVGDASFQKKCLNKMESIGLGGRTVIFVSHSMAAITRLCDRAILLDHGHTVADGPSHRVAHAYLESGLGTSAVREWPDPRVAPGDAVARLQSVVVRTADGEITDSVNITDPVHIEVTYENLQSTLKPTVSLHFINDAGVCLFATNDFNNLEWWKTPRSRDMVSSTCCIPGNLLAEGRVSVLVAVCTYDPDVVHAIEPDAVSFTVVDRTDGEGVRGVYGGNWPGVVRPMLEWRVAGHGAIITMDERPAEPLEPRAQS